jgi:hypothetical protein
MRTAIVLVDSDNDDIRRIKEHVSKYYLGSGRWEPVRQSSDGCVVHRQIDGVYVNMLVIIIPETHPLYNVGLLGISLFEVVGDGEKLGVIIDKLLIKYG